MTRTTTGSSRERSETMNDVIEVSGLVTAYGTRTVLDGIDLHVPRGIVFGLLGRNGAGKTTLLETIVGLRRPASGSVRVLGVDPAADRAETTRRVAVQPQAASLFPTLTAVETLRLFAALHAEPRDPGELLHELDLTDAADTRVKHLSGGQQRRLLLAIALVGGPEVLVLDEPSAGLDPAARQRLWRIIAAQCENGVTVVLSTHLMEEAESVCERIAILAGSRIAVSGEPGELARRFSEKATVSFTVPADTPPAVIDALGLDGMLAFAPEPAGLRVSIETADPDAVVRRLTFTPSLPASGFSVSRDSLEKLFLDVTG